MALAVIKRIANTLLIFCTITLIGYIFIGHSEFEEYYVVLLHPLFVFFTIMVSVLIFMQGTLSYRYEKGSLQFIIGLLFFVIATFEFFHMITFESGDSSFLRSTHWFLILAGLTKSIGFFTIFLFKDYLSDWKIPRYHLLFLIITVTIISVLLLLAFSDYLPSLISADGYTSLRMKLVSIIFIFHILIIAILSHYYNISKNADYLSLIEGFIYVFLGEVVFSLYSEGFALLFGHIFIILGYTALLLGLYYPNFKQIYQEKELVKAELELVQKKLVRTKSAIRKKINKVQENERKRVSQDLHDSIGQSLFAIILELKILSKYCTNEKANEQIKHLETIVRNLMIEVKELAFRLRPSLVEEVGLIPALKLLIQRINKLYNININFECTLSADYFFTPKVETVIFRICQESITNAIKYANAESIIVNLSRPEGFIEVKITDNGQGFIYDPIKNNGNTLGLDGMKERALSVNGTLAIASEIGKGTTIQVQIPIN